jgi:hypothetical protein
VRWMRFGARPRAEQLCAAGARGVEWLDADGCRGPYSDGRLRGALICGRISGQREGPRKLETLGLCGCGDDAGQDLAWRNHVTGRTVTLPGWE